MFKKKDLLLYGIIFLGTFLILQAFQKGGDRVDPVLDTSDIGIKMVKSHYAVGKDIRVELKNNTEQTLILASRCPDAPVDIFKFTNEGFIPVEKEVKRNCEKIKDIELNPGKKEIVSLQDYSYSFFGEPGLYKLELITTIDGIEKTFTAPQFEIKEPGTITRIWRVGLYQPMLNALVGILIYLPGHQLWLAVILLTLLIRTILLIPSQKAIRAQRQMQVIQPKLEEIKKKYKDDQSRLAQETMLLWKTHKVHPLSSCLPIVIQMPILIALYYVIRTGLQPRLVIAM